MVLQDWVPVLAFVEKSVTPMWSKEVKRGKIVVFVCLYCLLVFLGSLTATCHCVSFSTGISHNLEADHIRKDDIKKVVEKTSCEEKGSLFLFDDFSCIFTSCCFLRK